MLKQIHFSLFLLLAAAMLLIVACSSSDEESAEVSDNPITPANTLEPSLMPTLTPSPTLTHTPTPTLTPTPLPTATPAIEETFCTSVTEVPPADCQALIALYNSTHGDVWLNRTGWGQTPTPCTWYGITCTANRVTSIILEGNNLMGSLPPQIIGLSELQILRLGENAEDIPNNIGGNLPPEIGGLYKLTQMDLEFNDLTGAIPIEIGNLTSLVELRLRANQLSGSIPPQIGSLNNLQILTLDQNQLSGAIPPEIGNLGGLQRLFLNGNQLVGDVPPSIANLTNLIPEANRTDFSFNALTANIETTIFLSSKDGDWLASQTAPPSAVEAVASDNNTVLLSWVAIPYSGDVGGYEISYSTSPDQDFFIATITPDKSYQRAEIRGLQAGITYYFRIRTLTEAHPTMPDILYSAFANQNRLLSDYSEVVSATTTGNPPN